MADYAGQAVVVVNSSGMLRFRYKADIKIKAKNSTFNPYCIDNDIKLHILINDDLNSIFHIIDCDGNFIRYIEYPCNGGVSLDCGHNLVIGNFKTGLIKIIKYLE